MLPVPTKPKLKQKSTRRDLEELKFSGSHARMIEQRRNSGQISCAECRRLRIKCNKQIPCQSCRRRGCAALCPNGSLYTGQGTRFVLAATEHLHRRVSRMSERIWQLEDALSELQARYSTEPHPLLRPDLLGASQHDNVSLPCANNPEVAEPTSELVESLGTLSISDGGASRFFGPTGGSHCLLMSDNLSSQEFAGGSSDSARDSTGPELPHAIEKFTLPLLFKPFHSTLNVENLVSDYLPTWEQAHRLVEAYLEEATWLFHNVSKDQILFELLPAYYVNNIPHVAQADSNPHRLCLLFLIFAIGALLDASQKPGNAEAEHYHQVARVAICLQSVMEKPSLETIQALYLLSAYNVMSGNELAGKETSMETSWSLVTLAAHLAHTLGLHRDSFRWGLSADIITRRRVVFWDLSVADVWNCLEAGRPPTFSLPYIDCQFPGGGSPRDKVHIGSDSQAFYGCWPFRFASDCVADVAARTLIYDFPSYSTVLELDRKVRNFPVTEAAEEFVAAASGAVPAKPTDRGIGMMESMDRFVMSNAREVILLHVHRSYFAKAIIESPANPLNSAYTPSFLAAYRASLTVLHTIKVQYGLHPKLTARFWLIWTFAFSAAIVFGTVVTRGPRSPMASDAMKELRDACILFSKASSHSRRAQKALPIITKLTEKAHNSLLHARSDMPNELGQQWGVTKNKGDDELAIFAGRMKFVSIRRQTTDGTSERCTNADRSVEWSSSLAPESQQEQNQVELALPQSYSREQLDPVWPHWHLETMTKEIYPYVGCSKLCCFLCFTFLRFFGQRDPFFNIRGCHGRVYPLWSLPDASGLHVDMCMELSLALQRTLDHMSREMTRAVATSPHHKVESSVGITDDYPDPPSNIRDYHPQLTIQSEFHPPRASWATVFLNSKAREVVANFETKDDKAELTRSPPRSGKCARCDRKTSRKCSKCTGPWLCSRTCEGAYNFRDHNSKCAIPQPFDSADYLERACWKNEIPDNVETLEEFGFTKFPSTIDQRNLLGVFIGLTRMGIGSRELRKWQEDGMLLANIIFTYEGKPEYSCGGYYRWFREKLYILSHTRAKSQTLDMFTVARPYLDAGDQSKDLHELVLDTKRKSFLLYAILFNGQHPDPSHSEKSIQDLYYTFGFCLCCDVRGEEVLARLYMMLICRCSFQDFWLAYQNHSLIALMDAKGLAKARQDIQHLETFLKIKPNDWCPTVWHLRLFTRCQVVLPGPCVARDYGFFNCETVEEHLALKHTYTRLLGIPEVDPMKLHVACIKGELYGFARKYLPNLQWRFRKLMKNSYPGHTNVDKAGKWRWTSPVHCQSG